MSNKKSKMAEYSYNNPLIQNIQPNIENDSAGAEADQELFQQVPVINELDEVNMGWNEQNINDSNMDWLNEFWDEEGFNNSNINGITAQQALLNMGMIHEPMVENIEPEVMEDITTNYSGSFNEGEGENGQLNINEILDFISNAHVNTFINNYDDQVVPDSQTSVETIEVVD